MENIEKWVREAFAPVVLTCTTPEVERLAQKNNLAFSDMLNGFSMLQQVDTPLRSVSHSATLTDFNFRFLSTTQFAALPLADSMRLLNEIVMHHPPSPSPANGSGGGAVVVDLDMPPVRSVDDVSVFLRVIGAANNPEPLPWYREFKRTLMDTFRCADFSMMGQPAALLLVVSSTESNPRASFEQLSGPQNLPMVFSQGIYDANLPKFYLVVHDVAETDGTSIDPESILRNLHIPQQTGAVLLINSLAVDNATSANVSTWSKHPYVRAALFSDVNSGNYPYLTDHVGGFCSSQDLQRLASFVRNFGLKFVLPALESRIFQLNEVVSANKKGVKNVFKSWLRKPKDLSARTAQQVAGGGMFTGSSSSAAGTIGAASAVSYRADSIEAQTRLLADTAFMVRDYDLALQMYRLARDDFKSDKALYDCANANEMIALCLLLTKGSPVQMTNALDAASAAYYKVSNPATCRLAVRASILAGEIYVTLSHSGLFTDYMDNASAALIRGSTMEQGICSAVLMERAALCDLQARQPKFRKFGFRMVMAGHVYDSLGHSAHSARCYALARAVYDASGWFQVEDHINFTLAQQSNRLNDPMAAINLFLKLIGTGRNSASQQEALLYEFGMIVKEFLSGSGSTTSMKSGPVMVKSVGGGDPSSSSMTTAKKLVVRDLCMPELDDKSTVVFAPVNATGINREIDGQDLENDAWKELEQVLEKQTLLHRYATSSATANGSQATNSGNKDTSGGGTTGGGGGGGGGAGRIQTANRWLAPTHAFHMPYRGKRGANQLKKPRQYALGEKIYVEFEMKNALSCAVDVENIHLYGKFEPYDDQNKPTTGGGASFDVPETDAFGNSSSSTEHRIAVDRVHLQLLPVSEERVRLAVCPKVPGILRITGVRWSICGGDVLGEHAFQIPGPLLQDTRANKDTRARAPNVTLVADVVGHMPWLGVTVEPMQPSASATEAFVGEILTYKLSLFNAGTANLGHLQLCCADLSLCASGGGGGGKADDLAKYVGASGQAVDLTHVVLKPGERRDLVLWARASRPGKLQPRLLFKYKRLVDGEDPERALARAVHVKLELTVLPSVNVTHSIEPSYAASGEYILGLTVTNAKPPRQLQQQQQLQKPETAAVVNLAKLMCVSKSWRVIPFHHPHNNSSASVRTAAQLDAQETSTSYFRIVPNDKATSGEASCSIDLLSSEEPSRATVDTATSSLPLSQMLCLDNALEMLKQGEASSMENGGASGPGAAGGGGGGGGGMRSIQSVRRANKALKGADHPGGGGDPQSQQQIDKPHPQPTTQTALLHSIDVDLHLILVWSTSKSSSPSSLAVVGQTNLTAIKLKSPLKTSACPLTITLDYADSVSLRPMVREEVASPANALSFAQVDVVMTVRNDSTLSSRPIDFTMELLHPEETQPSAANKLLNASSSPSSALLAPAPHFFWSGLTKKRVSHFPPNGHVQFKLKACFMTAGVYDLNRFRFEVAASPSATGGDTTDPTAVAASVQGGVFVFPVKYLVYVRPPSA